MKWIARSLAIKVLLATFAGCLMLPRLSLSQPPALKVVDLKPLDYKGYEYRVGEPFKLNVDYSTVSLNDRQRLRARIFRGDFGQLLNKSSSGNCITYFSALYQPHHYNGGLEFGLNFSEPWLRIQGNRLVDEHYTLVFELDGPQGSWIDIDRNFVNEYFRLGFTFIVRADPSFTDGEAKNLIPGMRKKERQLAEDRKNRQTSLASQVQAAKPALPCWTLQVLRGSLTLHPGGQLACAGARHKGAKEWLSRFFGS